MDSDNREHFSDDDSPMVSFRACFEKLLNVAFLMLNDKRIACKVDNKIIPLGPWQGWSISRYIFQCAAKLNKKKKNLIIKSKANKEISSAISSLQ